MHQLRRPFNVYSHLFQCPRRHIVRSSFPSVTTPDVNYVSELYSGAGRYPNRAALIDSRTGDSYSYTQAKQATLNVGSGLIRRCRFGRGKVLTIFTDNRPEFVFAMHGAMAAGGIASPVNCHATPNELVHPLNDAGAIAVLTDRDRLAVVQEAAKQVPSLKHIFLVGETEEAARRLGCIAFDELLNDDDGALGGKCVEVDPDNDVALLPYSSGTSGLPKGVMLSHNNFGVNLRQERGIFLNKEATDIALGALPFYHIYALNTIIGNLLHTGGTLVTMPKFEPESFLANIERHGVNFLHVVPPLILFLVQSPLVSQFRLGTLEQIVSAAAPLGADLQSKAEALLGPMNPKLQLYQGYGLTETSPYTHCGVWHEGIDEERLRLKTGSIGRSVPSQECKIVDPVTRQERSQPGEDGELAVRGPHVMLGYLNRPEATAEAIDEEGWFYTGDIARYDDDGFFYVTDRVKELIKYKGFQVAPAELEAVLLSHSKIKDCAVIGRPDDRAGELPMAFIVPNSSDLNEHQVHEHVNSLLSDYKQLRGGIQFVDSIPKSASGKLLRRELRKSM